MESVRGESFPFTLAAVDIDDTLLGPDQKVSGENRRAIRRLLGLGCRVVLASGRRHANMLPFHRELGLDGYVVSCQGARVEHSRTGQVVRRALITPGDVAALVSEGLSRGYTVLLCLAEGMFAQAESTWVDVYRRESCGDAVAIADLGALAGRPVEKVLWGGPPSDIAVTRDEMAARHAGRLSASVTSDWSLEFAAYEANKAAGIAAVASAVGISREHVLAFGDGNNDVPLLQWAGLGVAMPHGRPAARMAAKLVGPEGDPESALARAVDAVVLQHSGLGAMRLADAV